MRGESSGRAGGGSSISYGMGAGGNALSVCIGDEMSSGSGLFRRAWAGFGSGFNRCSGGSWNRIDLCCGGMRNGCCFGSDEAREGNLGAWNIGSLGLGVLS